MRGWLSLAVVLLLLGAGAARAEEDDLSGLSLDELMDVEITTASKKRQQRATVADAIYVITAEDIRRSGATSIPEALRLVPEVHVARIDSNKWAIGVRGFTSRLSRSVLVMIDGRTVYNPLFAGTYWEIQDTLLEDIDRIEVIRGPGGSLWGANAFNGVINIITKDSAATQGAFATAGGGSEEQGFGAARYGGKIGEDLTYRLYAKAFNRDGGHTPEPGDYDDWHMARGGFRLDWRPRKADWLTLQGDLYGGELGNRVTIPQFMPPFARELRGDSDVSGGNLLGRWTRTLSDTSDVALQIYYDHTFRRDSNFREERDTVDGDAQHRFALPWRQEIVWGVGYRVTWDDTGGVPGVALVPSGRTDNLLTWFVDDEIAIVPGVLSFTIGSKFEQNDYSGFEMQPSGRLLWTPIDGHAFWGSIARGVRTPSRIEDDAQLTGRPINLDPTNPSNCLPDGAPCLYTRIVGNRDFDAERVIAYQIGHRAQATSRFFVDTALFYNQFDDLLSVEPLEPFPEAEPPLPHVISPFNIANKIHGESYGGALAVHVFPVERWRLHAAYSYLHIDLKHDPGSTDPFTTASTEGSSPQHQMFAQSQVDLPWNFELDTTFRYVDHLPAQDVRSYVTFDVRLAVHVTPSIELAAVGQNLWDSHHREFAGGSAIERSAYGQIRWHY